MLIYYSSVYCIRGVSICKRLITRDNRHTDVLGFILLLAPWRCVLLNIIGLHVFAVSHITVFSPPPHGSTVLRGSRSPHYCGMEITLRTRGHITLGSTSLDGWSACRGEFPWHHTTPTWERHPCPDGIRTRSTRKRAAAYPRLRPRGHRDRLIMLWSPTYFDHVTLKGPVSYWSYEIVG